MRDPAKHVYFDAIRMLERVENVFKEVETRHIPSHLGTCSPRQAEALGERVGEFRTCLHHALRDLHAADIDGILVMLHAAGIQEDEVQ